MAQKAAKSQANRNAAILRRLQLLSVGLHGFFFLLRFILFRSSANKTSYMLYALFGVPSILIVLLFTHNSSPVYLPNGELKRAGDDLEAKGLTEYLFDVLYWTWGSLFLAALLGDRGWWAWIAIPLYSVYALYTAYGSVRQGLGAMAGPQDVGAGDGTSKRQAKMEKRGGQKTMYR